MVHFSEWAQRPPPPNNKKQEQKRGGGDGGGGVLPICIKFEKNTFKGEKALNDNDKAFKFKRHDGHDLSFNLLLFTL